MISEVNTKSGKDSGEQKKQAEKLWYDVEMTYQEKVDELEMELKKTKKKLKWKREDVAKLERELRLTREDNDVCTQAVFDLLDAQKVELVLESHVLAQFPPENVSKIGEVELTINNEIQHRTSMVTLTEIEEINPNEGKTIQKRNLIGLEKDRDAKWANPNPNPNWETFFKGPRRAICGTDKRAKIDMNNVNDGDIRDKLKNVILQLINNVSEDTVNDIISDLRE